MNTDTIKIDEGPKISFLEAFHGILFAPKKVFDDLYEEDSFTILVYGTLGVFLSSLGKLESGSYGFLNIVGIEVIGFISWFFVGLLLAFFGTIFKTPNNNLARLLGFTGLSSIPFLLMTSVNLISNFLPIMYPIFSGIISIWSFILFWISLSKSFQLEAWRVLLMAIIPFVLGAFLFTFLLANVLGVMFSGFPMSVR